jgi:hypothetical protein
MLEVGFAGTEGDFGSCFTAFGRSFAGSEIFLGAKARGCTFFLAFLDLRDFFTARLFFDLRDFFVRHLFLDLEDFFVLRSFFNPNCFPWDFLLIFLGPE